MPLDFTPAVTGSLRYVDSDAATIEHWLGELATGDEYGGAFVLAKVSLAGMWGIDVHEGAHVIPAGEVTNDGSLQGRATAIARQIPAVPVDRPAVPKLTGDLLEDVRAVTGLTLGQIAQATRVSERAVASWRAGTLPEHREELFQRLRSIGLSLVGGLGADGVRRWFTAGAPTRLERLAAGEVEQIAAEARAYETSPAT